MRVVVLPDAEALGRTVAAEAAHLLREAVQRRGEARLLLATGTSQLTTLAALVREEVPWPRVEAFHLDEYIGIGPDHPASFRGYLRSRFAQLVPLKAMHEVETEGDLAARMADLTARVRAAPMDVALVGVGENGHVAFNDPPADFATPQAFAVVTLDATCRAQQVREGWFPRLDDVPERAVSMTVPQILTSKVILSAVPYAAKAPIIARLLQAQEPTPDLPATALLRHPHAVLYLDRQSSALVPPAVLHRYATQGTQA